MLYGTITHDNGWLLIKVNGYNEIRFLWYSKRDAIKKYRQEHGLVGKHIYFVEY